MSQATLLGLCSDNVVTVLTPSSTIECATGSSGFSGSCGSCCDPCSSVKITDIHSETISSDLISGTNSLSFPILLPTVASYAITGSLQIQFQSTPPSWTTGPPNLIYLQITLDSALNRINRYVTFRYNASGSTYYPDPVDVPFSFLIKAKDATTITVSVVNAGGSVVLRGSLWYQYIQYSACG
jgi:hypothetical protein